MLRRDDNEEEINYDSEDSYDPDAEEGIAPPSHQPIPQQHQQQQQLLNDEEDINYVSVAPVQSKTPQINNNASNAKKPFDRKKGKGKGPLKASAKSTPSSATHKKSANNIAQSPNGQQQNATTATPTTNDQKKKIQKRKVRKVFVVSSVEVLPSSTVSLNGSASLPSAPNTEPQPTTTTAATSVSKPTDEKKKNNSSKKVVKKFVPIDPNAPPTTTPMDEQQKQQLIAGTVNEESTTSVKKKNKKANKKGAVAASRENQNNVSDSNKPVVNNRKSKNGNNAVPRGDHVIAMPKSKRYSQRDHQDSYGENQNPVMMVPVNSTVYYPAQQQQQFVPMPHSGASSGSPTMLRSTAKLNAHAESFIPSGMKKPT